MIVLFDTNVFLNVIRDEAEFAEASEILLRKAQTGEIRGLASSIVLIETKWALHERKEHAKGDMAVSLIEEIVEIIPVDKEIAKEAIDLVIRKKTELLDSIHAVTAAMSSAIFATRDEGLRRKVEDIVPVMKPEEILRKTAA